MKFSAVISHQLMQHLFETLYSSELFELVTIQMKGIIQDGKKMFKVSVSADHPELVSMLELQFNQNGKVFDKDWYLNLRREVT